VTAEFGSWLTLHFGTPKLDVRDAVPTARSKALQRRAVFVEGQHRLWIDLCDWEIIEAGRRRFHSDQRRGELRRAADHLDGQVLQGFSLSLRPLRCTFRFDAGSTLVTQRYSRARQDDELWRFYSSRTYLGLRSDADLVFGTLDPERLSNCPALALEIAV